MYVYRQNAIKQLANLMIFGDNPNGEIFYVNADKLPRRADRRPCAASCSTTRARRSRCCRSSARRTPRRAEAAAERADLRFGKGPQGQIFVLNKRDGIIRLLVPNGQTSASTLR